MLARFIISLFTKIVFAQYYFLEIRFSRMWCVIRMSSIALSQVNHVHNFMDRVLHLVFSSNASNITICRSNNSPVKVGTFHETLDISVSMYSIPMRPNTCGPFTLTSSRWMYLPVTSTGFHYSNVVMCTWRWHTLIRCFTPGSCCVFVWNRVISPTEKTLYFSGHWQKWIRSNL